MTDADAASAPTEPDVAPPGAATRPTDAPRAEPAPEALPATVGRFDVIRKLGEGGMGIVLEAHDPRLNRRIALKLVRASTSSTRARLVREAQAMARVAHPNVVSVFEAGVFEDEVFIAMELVPNAMTLGEWLAASARSWRDVVAICVAAGRGLAAVHEAGIVHRDFKLDNVLVGVDGRARVLDFGIARGRRPGDPVTPGAEDDAPPPGGNRLRPLDMQLTRPNTILGTPIYMSPEQFRGADVGAASDQFSFCVAVYRALYGKAPFPGDDLESLRQSVTAGHVEPPPADAAPHAVHAAILRGLRPDAADRWPTFVELVDELEAALGHDPNRDPSTGRNARRLVPGALLAIAVTTFAILLSTGRLRSMDLSRILLQSVLATCAMLVVFAVFRRQLTATRTNRRLAAIFLLAGVSVSLHRLLGLRLGMPPHHVLMGDSLIAAALFGFAALVVERWFAISAVAGVLGAIACSFGMETAMIGFPLALLVIAAVPVVFWRSEPVNRAGAGGAGGAVSGAGTSVTRSGRTPRTPAT